MQDLVNYFRGAKLWSDLIAVYQAHGTNKVFTAILAKAAGTPLPKLRPLIEAELKAILNKLETQAKEVAAQAKPIKEELSQVLSSKHVTTSRAQLIGHRNDLWSQAKYQHAKLSAYTTDKDRATGVANLKRIWDELDYTWLQIDTYDKKGFFLDTEYLINYKQMDTRQLNAALYRLRPQRSKARKRLKEATTEAEQEVIKQQLLSFDGAIETITLLLQSR